jgi:hypothetical protein
MKKIFFALISILFILNTLSCFAQTSEPRVVDIIGKWRNDMSCRGMELNQLIKEYKDNAVPILQECCKKHSSACLPVYSGPDNKTLLYTAIYQKAYKVAEFLFNYSPNYRSSVDAYGETVNTRRERNGVIVKITEENPLSKTPLMLTCSRCEYNGTAFLLKHNASLIKKNGLSKNAYIYAKEANCDKIFIAYVKKEYDKQWNEYNDLGSLEKDEQEHIKRFNEIKDMLIDISITDTLTGTENNFGDNLL